MEGECYAELLLRKIIVLVENCFGVIAHILGGNMMVKQQATQ
jgi:hypothetical protein